MINRPKALNALNETVLDELSRAFDEVAVNGAIKAVLLTDNGNKAFVSGVDITKQYKAYTFGYCFASTDQNKGMAILVDSSRFF